MWADGIVVASPALDHDPGLLQRIENLPVQQLIAQPGIETLDVAVLPGAARRDVGRLGTDGGNPLPYERHAPVWMLTGRMNAPSRNCRFLLMTRFFGRSACTLLLSLPIT